MKINKIKFTVKLLGATIFDVEGYGAKYSNFRTEKQKLMLLQGGQEVLLQDR